MHIRDWSSDVCCSYLYIARPARRSVRLGRAAGFARGATRTGVDAAFRIKAAATGDAADGIAADRAKTAAKRTAQRSAERAAKAATAAQKLSRGRSRSEEHTSELQLLMRNSYAVFCLKKKNSREI